MNNLASLEFPRALMLCIMLCAPPFPLFTSTPLSSGDLFARSRGDVYAVYLVLQSRTIVLYVLVGTSGTLHYASAGPV